MKKSISSVAYTYKNNITNIIGYVYTCDNCLEVFRDKNNNKCIDDFLINFRKLYDLHGDGIFSMFASMDITSGNMEFIFLSEEYDEFSDFNNELKISNINFVVHGIRIEIIKDLINLYNPHCRSNVEYYTKFDRY